LVYYDNERRERTCLTCRFRFKYRNGVLSDCPMRITLSSNRSMTVAGFTEGCVHHEDMPPDPEANWISRIPTAPQQSYGRCTLTTCSNNSGWGCCRNYWSYRKCKDRKREMIPLRPNVGQHKTGGTKDEQQI
jgi:hypothetical protein